VSAETAGQRVIAGVLRAALSAGFARIFEVELPVSTQRARLLRFARFTFPPRGAAFSAASAGGVAGEWVRVRGTEGPATVLYLHGGGYCTGSPATHRAVTGHLAAACRARVFAADYRLAPEHPFPAAVDDAVAAWRGLVDEGTAPRDLVIAGDSAGGGLAVATSLRLRELSLPQPRALVLFSPFVDLTLSAVGTEPPGEVMLTRPWLRQCAEAYLGGQDAREPLVSPVLADLHGLPPTLIQVGSDELLLGDARRLHDRLRQAGVRVRIEEYRSRWHVFQASAGVLADANRAFASAARFLEDSRS
jgi:monoterpene epsilon-lactone hydrolase